MTTLAIRLRHRTRYQFAHDVRLGPHLIRLHPAPTIRAELQAYDLAIRPAPLTLHWHFDPLANRVARVSFEHPTAALEIDITLDLALPIINPFDFVMDAEAATWPFAYPSHLERDLAPYRERDTFDAWLIPLLAGIDLAPQSPIGLLVALNQRIHDRIHYIKRVEPGVQAPAETVGSASGSCRDVAWLLVLAARAIGLAARFVSGYLVQLIDPEHPAPGLDRDGADLHAWAEIYLPGAGWIGFDATSGLITGAGHIALASGAHPQSAAAIDGTTSTSAARLRTEMTVERR